MCGTAYDEPTGYASPPTVVSNDEELERAFIETPPGGVIQFGEGVYHASPPLRISGNTFVRSSATWTPTDRPALVFRVLDRLIGHRFVAERCTRCGRVEHYA